MHWLGRFVGRVNVPGVTSILRGIDCRQQERERCRAEVERRHAKKSVRDKAERDQTERERTELTNRPIPPDIVRDMRAFRPGMFNGEDQSPLAYVDYRVGKTRGLPRHARQRRLKACFRVEIPADFPRKYRDWERPVTAQRYHAIRQHLKMLANLRRGQRNMDYAVADWEEDFTWFETTYSDMARHLGRFPPSRHR